MLPDNCSPVSRFTELQKSLEIFLEVDMNNAIFRKALFLRLFIAALLILGLQNMALHAQVSTADVVGTVTDASGAIVPGAKVVLTNVATQVQATAVSNSSGDYLFTYLVPGTYSLRAEATGFQALVLSNIVLAAGDRARENAPLKVGKISETVEVSAETPLLQRESSSIGSVIGEQDVQDLPLDGRNFFNLVQVQPGVTAGAPNAISSGQRPDDRRATSTISANGQPDFYNNELVDGVDNNEILQGVIAVRPSIDAIDQITIDTSNFTAEVGRDAGAVVNIITKSGSNGFHGSVYEFFRNDIFDAREFTAPVGVVPKPEYRQNQFGGSIGGPIVKDKTFFFADAEDSRVIQGQSTGPLTVPTLFEQQNPGNFSDLTGGPIVPVLSATGLAYFQLYPQPNLPASAADNYADNYTNVVKTTAYNLTADGRIDHHFSNGDTLYARYSYNKTNSYIPGAFPTVAEDGLQVQPNGSLFSYAGTSNQSAHGALLNYTHLFTPNLIMELKTGYTRVNWDTVNLNNGVNVSNAFGVVNGNIQGVPGTTGLTPVDFLTGGYAALGDSPFLPIVNTQNSFQYQGALTYTRGTHVFKFGGELIRRQLNYFQSSEPLGALFYVGITGNALADLLTGYNFGYERENTLVSQGFRRWEPGGFAQDNWRLTPNLTLNLGIRYDVFTPFTEAQNRYANFDYPNLKLITGAQDPHIGVHTNYGNVAPRVGFAQSIGAHTVVRGGYGISYYPTQISLSILLANPPTAFQSVCENPACVGMPLPYPTAPSTTNLSGNLSYAASNLNTSMQQMYNLAVQQEVGANVFTLAYVGELGRRQLFVTDVNTPAPTGPYATSTPIPPPALLTAATLPNVGPIQGFLPEGGSNYNAMQAVFARRFSHGLSFNANYTWAHGLSNAYSSSGESLGGQGLLPADPHYDYGNSGLDVRNRVAVTATYVLPFGQSANGARALLVKGWSTNLISFWQSGLPFTVLSSAPNPYGIAQINLPDVSTDRPNMSGESTTPAHRSHLEWFNIDAFTPQPAGTAGDESFNQLYGPNQRRTDFSIFKAFNLSQYGSLQFRAECFNVSNTPNFSLVASNYTITSYLPVGTIPVPGDKPAQSGGFGQLTQTTPNVGPREFQFALKYLF